MRALRTLIAITLLALSPVAARAEGGTASVPQPDGYRQDNYRSPVPASLTGATVVTADELHRLMETRPIIVIDVLPQPPRPDKLPPETLWRPPPRHNIPGSIWLANTGYGALSLEAENYFRRALERLTLGDKARMLAFYCEAQCWMSWNAAKRALSYGYRHVYWFPGGVHDWTKAGYPTLSAQPVPMQ
ncbi:MAG: PQQ-dependent catabolism-associated CXXCW motif protein [Rhodospirillaceae bacterium]|nr:MAG: PQQ-dependent catabolism-associated CXXCW motif protein [Rhodospirillaceae bacterium]